MSSKTVLITGASSGIGLASVRRFHSAGWNVAATMRNPERAPAELAALPRVAVFRLDVTDPAGITLAVDAALARFGSIDVLVNNAGYGLVGAFETTDPARIERQFATNFFGAQAVLRALLPHFRARAAGTIVNVSSIGGRTAMPLYSAYAATKFALEGFTESLQYELRPLGIRVKLVEPGAVHTEFISRSADIVAPTEPYRAIHAAIEHRTPELLRFAARPERVANTIFRAATDGRCRIRYAVGADAWLFGLLSRMVPESIRFALIRLALGRLPRSLPAPTA